MTLVAIVFFVLLLAGLPVGYVLGIAGIAGIVQIGGEPFFAMAPKRFYAGLDLFPFLAMPFFILAGDIMNRSGITTRLVGLADALVGYLRGGMAHSNMVASVLFAGITGAATADAAAFGTTLVPAMVSRGYSRPFACAVTAAGSIIGPTIPPSTLMVVYGSLMGVSIAGLFAAGILPGLLICLICMAVIAALGRRLGLPKGEGGPSLRRILRAFRESLLALGMPVIILGFILGGITTPTEAASIAVAYALILGGLVYRTLRLADLYAMLARTAVITGVVFLIIASASILGWWMTFEQIPQAIAALFLSVSTDPGVVIGMILILLLVIGMFMDINAALVILAPVLALMGMLVELIVQPLVKWMAEFSLRLSGQLENMEPGQTPPAVEFVMRLFEYGANTAVVLSVLAVLLAIAWAVQRRAAGQYHDNDTRESAWSAQALLGKLRAQWQHRLAQLQNLVNVTGRLGASGLFAALTIRRLYAQTMRLAAQRGYPRAPARTPYEHQSTLEQAFPGCASELAQITEAYVGVHYGELPEQPQALAALKGAFERVKASEQRTT